jgi:hypothetical protein
MILVPRSSGWGRYLMLGSGVTVALLNAILRGVAPDGGWIAVLFVPLGVVALGWIAMVGIAQDQPFESLDPQERLEALGLAWDRAPFAPTALTGAAFVAYLTAGLAGVWEACATWGSDWNGQRFALWTVAGCVWLVIGIVFALTTYSQSVRGSALRQIAVRWVNQWHETWLDCACEIAPSSHAERYAKLPTTLAPVISIVTVVADCATVALAARPCFLLRNSLGNLTYRTGARGERK